MDALGIYRIYVSPSPVGPTSLAMVEGKKDLFFYFRSIYAAVYINGI